jgi:hypothetical protein
VRIVVFDKTDRIGLRRGQDGGAAGVEVGLAPAWWLGSKLHAMFGANTRGVSSWTEAIDFACAHDSISDFQIWGHGGWGYMAIGDSRLSIKTLSMVDALRERMTPDGQLWLRCCSAFGGREGRIFARALADRLQRRVVSHTYVIGVRQSGTHSLLPGADPTWPLEEGVVMQNGDPVRAKGSGFFEPNTISCFRLDRPTGW